MPIPNGPVCFDIDDTLCPLIPALLDRYNQSLPGIQPLVKYSSLTAWELPGVDSGRFWKNYGPDIYGEILCYHADGMDLVQYHLEREVDVRFVSWCSDDGMARAKKDWLADVLGLGYLDLDRLMIPVFPTEPLDKLHIPGSALFDDRPETVQAWWDEGRGAGLMPRPWSGGTNPRDWAIIHI